MEGEVETVISVFDLDFYWKGGWERGMTKGGSLTTGSGEVVVHDDVGKGRGRGALSVSNTIMHMYARATHGAVQPCAKRLRLQSQMVVAVRSSGISGHDSNWPRRVVSGDSGSAG